MSPILSYQNIATLTPVYRTPVKKWNKIVNICPRTKIKGALEWYSEDLYIIRLI